MDIPQIIVSLLNFLLLCINTAQNDAEIHLSVYSLIASCIGMFSHSRHHDTVDRMDAGFMQTVFTSDSLTSCLYCLFSLNLGFLNAKWIFLKDETLIIMKLSSFPWLYSL